MMNAAAAKDLTDKARFDNTTRGWILKQLELHARQGAGYYILSEMIAKLSAEDVVFFRDLGYTVLVPDSGEESTCISWY
jgi:hypothetical protein